jgi:branched-chain amino acid transport system permease protein
VLLATFIGGIPFFFGPVVGSVIFILFVAALSGFTKAWLLYLGLFFCLMVLYAPGGVVSIALMQVGLFRAGRLRSMAVPYALAALAALVALGGLIGLVESVYRLSDVTSDPQMRLFSLDLNAHDPAVYAASAVLLLAGLAAMRFAARMVSARWDAVQAELKGSAA